MMNILVDLPVYPPALEQLQKMEGVKVTLVEKQEEKPRPLPLDLIADCHVLFCSLPPQNHELMAMLAMIQISSAGYQQLTDKGFEKRGIRACNALGVFDVPIAEWNVAMMINLLRDLRGLIRNQETQVWDRAARFQTEIRGLTAGIWGYGGIGRETARLAKALGMKVHVLTRNGARERKDIYCVQGTGDPEGLLPDRVYLMQEKNAFLKDLDFLIMAIPQTTATEGIIGEAELKTLRPTTFILNPARGPLIQEQALLKALREGWIAGAAIDTHYYYPMPADHPLWKMNNVIMTPHISGSTGGTHFLERVWDIFLQNIQRLINGDPLINELTPLQLMGH